MTSDAIKIIGAREKNLKDISISIPKNQITSVVGVSGSGKSALVFDTIAAESQRQLNETYSSFIRNRLPHYGKPDVDDIQNLSVSIIINQKRLGENARSTVGTVTDIYSLLRLLFSRIGEPFAGYSDVFSFNNPQGMCKTCEGLGVVQDVQIDAFIDAFDDIRGLFSKENNVDPSWFSLNSKGACPNCKGLGTVEYDLAFMENVTEVCEVCNGKRFIPKVLNYTCCQKNISDILQMSINEALDFFDRGSIREKIVPLQKVGLGYLNLGQPLTTLSGGELQRLKLAVQLKAPQPIYVLDEPTTGLHTKDIGVLLDVFHELIERGSTLIVIEHNLEMMCQADWIIDLGPGAGEYGGQVLFQGSPDKLLECNKSITAQYLRKYLVN